MARFIYDVDKTTRYIDIHKQFSGGLKTVDTDDALKDIYLREAENVSLSEFNFLEKRYGLHNLKEYAPWVSLASTSSIVQGYFEYYVNANTVHKIIAIEGSFYIDSGSGFVKQSLFKNEDLNAITAIIFTSSIYFSNKTLWYYDGNPNGVVTGVSGDVIQSTNGNMYSCSGGTSWTVFISSVTFPFSEGFFQGVYYFDNRTNRYYIWNNPSGKTGKLTFLPEFESMLAQIQSTRQIEGVRLDDKLYIATGTRPVYYKGDGNLYVFPEYKMSDLDIQKLGYDLNNFDLEAAFTTPEFTITSTHGTQYPTGTNLALDTITIKGSQTSKRFPYVAETTPTQISVAIHLYNNASLNRWGGTGTDVAADVNLFDSIMDTAALNAWQGTPGTNETNTVYGTIITSQYGPGFSDRRYRTSLKPTVYIKPAGALSSLYEELTDTGAVELTNDIESGSTNRLPNANIALSNFVFQLKELATGYWDFKIEFKLAETGYFYPYELALEDTTNPLAYVQLRTKTLDTKVVEFTNIWVTPEELTDYKEEPYDTLKVHTCNRITEHNGRLCLFGSTTHPDYLFFSTISSKEYFPYNYSLQFTNDLQEPITSVNKFMNILVVQSPSYTWGIKGDSPFPLTAAEGEIYRKLTINPTIGCIAPYSVKNVRNQLYFLSKEGIFTLKALFAEDNRYNVDPIDRNIYNIVPRDTNAIATYFDDQYWLHFPTTGETLRYYVDKRAWVKDTYAAWNNFGGVHKYINNDGKLRFITELSQLENGNSVKIFEIELDYSLPTDLTKNITSKVTTSYLNQNQPFHPKNYKEAKFDFAIQNEYNTSNQALPISNYAETVNYVQFTVDLIDRHFYSITFEPDEIGTRPAAYTVEVDAVQVSSGNITETNGNLSTIRFMSNKTGNVLVKITSTGKIVTANMSATSIKLYDSTYDHTVTFNTMVLSEEGTLNIDPIDSYTSAEVAIPIDLGTRTGNWVFGTNNFGNVIVAIKTVKLSGRGYNSKVSIIEDSKSKWTLESLGITYKMKKARSR
jgi:hypothetical protein